MITLAPDPSLAKRVPQPQAAAASLNNSPDAGFASFSPSQLSLLDGLDAQASAAYGSYLDEIHISLAPSDSAKLAAAYNDWTATVAKPINTVPLGAEVANADVAAATLGPLPLTNDPSVHGISCFNMDSDIVEATKGPAALNVSACAQAAKNACENLQDSRTGKYYYDTWLYSGGKPIGASDNADQWGCYMAYYLPGALVHDAGLPFPDVPDYDTCLNNVYGQMLKTCSGSYDSARINVKTLPGGHSKDIGEAVDPNQIMYFMSKTLIPCGEDGDGCVGP